MGAAVCEHQSDVLGMLGEAGFGGEIGVEHFEAFGRHEAGGGGSGLEDGEGAGGVEAGVAGEFEAFGENGAMEPEDKGFTGGYLTAAGSPVVVSMSISTEFARLVRTAATSAVTACSESRRTTPGN